MNLIKDVAFAGIFAGLDGCGRSETDQVEGGAARGAATDAAVGLVGGPVCLIAGAVIGGGASASMGAATNLSRADLGEPVWDRR